MTRGLLQWVVDDVTTVEAVAIVLHREGGHARSRAWNLGQNVKQYHPWSPRPLSPRGDALHSKGFVWFFEADGVVEPGLFIEQLRQLELMLFDIAEAHPNAPVFLLGEGQGATLALTLSGFWPELIRGVVALGGQFAQVEGWTPDADRAGQRIVADVAHHFPGAEVRTGATLDLEMVDWLRHH